MCNPRQVMIHLARCIEQAWRQAVEQAATASGQVGELARLTAQVPLDAEMGDMPLLMLERVLQGEFAGFEPWAQDSAGCYHRDLGAVELIYDPAARSLTVEAQLTELVTAEARGAAEASGFTVGEVAVEAVGRYYSDGWGGRTLKRATAEAEAEAERKLAEAIDALHRQQHAAELAQAEAQARAQAEAAAAELLAQQQQAAREALRERLQLTLAAAQERVRHVMNRAVGEAYRQTLRQLVLESGGRVLVDEQTGSMINMELELY